MNIMTASMALKGRDGKPVLRVMLFFFLGMAFFSSCRRSAPPASAGDQTLPPPPQADSATMHRLAGIWVDDETDAVQFLVRDDSIFYPDTSSLPARFAVFDDTLVVLSRDNSRYPLKQVLDHSMVYESLTGEERVLRRSNNPDDSLLFLHHSYAPILLGQLVKRDSVGFSPSGDRYHLYIDVNPTRKKVYKTTYTDEGMAVQNVYFDNIIHIAVYEGRRCLFTHDFHKEEFASFVPEAFISGAVLSNMEFGRLVKEGCHFYATLCEPEGARCYVVDIVIGYDGSKNMKLVDY